MQAATQIKLQKYFPSELLQMYRKRAGLTQAQIASRIGLQSKRMVQSWEVGDSLPKSDRLKLLIELYLKNRVFIANQEQVEAQRLWQSVKEMHDTNSSGLLTYPVFDAHWFAALVQTAPPVTAAPLPLALVPIPEKLSASVNQASLYNLPRPTNRLVGREKEIAELCALIPQSSRRLVTLLGTAGTGKTRLATEVAHTLAAQKFFRDGVYWVNLAALRDPALVISAVAQVFDLKETSTSTLLAQLKQFLADKHLLLIMDNFEQITAAAPLVVELLAASPGLHVLTTSRILLQIYGEQHYFVPPLALPDKILSSWSPDELARYEAIQLFMTQARTVKPDFALTDENSDTIAQICRQLDGLPLALELAAVRIKIYSPRMLLKGLGSKLELLKSAMVDKDARHHTLRGALNWSYELLDAEAKALYRRLGVFADGVSLAAAMEVCLGREYNEAEGAALLDQLQLLINQSWLQPQASILQDDISQVRFGMLETLREFALEQLSASGELTEMRRRHTAYFVKLAEIAEPKIRETEQASWLDLLEAEHANLRAALEWSLAERDTATFLRLGGALWWFWHVRNYWSEGLRWLEIGLTQSTAQPLPIAVLAKATHARAGLTFYLGNFEEARDLFEQTLVLRREQGDKTAVSVCLHNLGAMAHSRSEYARATELHVQSLALKRELGYQWGIAHSLDELGTIALRQGNYARSLELLHESQRLFIEISDQYSYSCLLDNLGLVYTYLGNYQQARQHFQEGLDLSEKIANKEMQATIQADLGLCLLLQGQLAAAGSLLEASLKLHQDLQLTQGIGHSLGYLGLWAWREGDYNTAQELLLQSLQIKQPLGNRETCIWGLEGLGVVAWGQSQPERAVLLLAAASQARQELGAPLPVAVQQVYDEVLAEARQFLPSPDYARWLAAGNALSWEEALQLALKVTPVN